MILPSLFLSLATLIGNLFKKFKPEFLALEEDGAILRSFKDDKKKGTNLNYHLKVCVHTLIHLLSSCVIITCNDTHVHTFVYSTCICTVCLCNF